MMGNAADVRIKTGVPSLGKNPKEGSDAEKSFHEHPEQNCQRDGSECRVSLKKGGGT